MAHTKKKSLQFPPVISECLIWTCGYILEFPALFLSSQLLVRKFPKMQIRDSFWKLQPRAPCAVWRLEFRHTFLLPAKNFRWIQAKKRGGKIFIWKINLEEENEIFVVQICGLQQNLRAQSFTSLKSRYKLRFWI